MKRKPLYVAIATMYAWRMVAVAGHWSYATYNAHRGSRDVWVGGLR